MYIFGKDISEPVYFGLHYLDLYILGNEKLLDVYFRDKPKSCCVSYILLVQGDNPGNVHDSDPLYRKYTCRK